MRIIVKKLLTKTAPFHSTWPEEYIFICTKGAAAVCLACNKNTTALKEYNIKRHYKIKHASKLSGIRR
jgi:hypothetical protein